MLRASIALLSITSLAVSANVTLPSGQDWINHASEGLAPYWMMPSAQGEPIGNFPTFRCDDGTLLDVTNVCPELRQRLDHATLWQRVHSDEVTPNLCLWRALPPDWR